MVENVSEIEKNPLLRKSVLNLTTENAIVRLFHYFLNNSFSTKKIRVEINQKCVSKGMNLIVRACES